MKFKRLENETFCNNYLSVEIVWTLNTNADFVDLFTVV